MLRRLLIGLIVGLVVGGGIAAALVFGLHISVFGALLAYLFAALAGAITGMVAGKPIWAKGGQIEAGLKAIFGALLAAGGMFALRQWGGGLGDINLSFIEPSQFGHIGELPIASLPVISALLGALYGLDNTPAAAEEADAKAGGSAKKKEAPKLAAAGGAAKGKKRVATPAPELDEEDLEASVPSKKAKR
jgi:hypothetical protein